MSRCGVSKSGDLCAWLRGKMDKFWYRIELDAKGVVVKSERVGALDERDGKPSVYYFAAPSLACAEEMAYREYHRARQEARRAVYKATGRCKCGRSRENESAVDRAFVTCPKCRALHKPQHARAELRRKGLPVPPSPSKADHFLDRRNEEKRLVLEEVREQFLRLTMKPFGEWLNREIAKLDEKSPPHLRMVGSK